MALTLSTFADKNPPWQLSLLDANFAEIAALLNDATIGTLYLVDSGAPNAIVVQLPAGLALILQAGVFIQVRVANTNTSATVTLDIQGVGQNTVVNPPANPLVIGQIQQGGLYGFQFDGANWQLVSASGPGGTYDASTLSGSIQVNFQGGFAGFGDLRFGFAFPNPSGIPSSGMSLGGAGKTQVVEITDAQIPGLKGITKIRSAGDATSDGGDLLDFAGGSLGGNGGQAKYQGGTSVHGRAGDAVLHGGNTTDGIPGNAVIIGGETGPVGAGVKLIMTKPPTSSTFGTVAVFANSNALIEFLSNGEISLDASGTGPGLAGQPMVSGGNGAPTKWQVGFTGPIVVGAQTLHFNSGILTSVT